MAWPASTQTLANALKEVNESAVRIKSFTTIIRNNSEEGTVPRKRIINLHTDLQKAITSWNNAKSIPGIVAYAKDQFDDPTLDVVTEFNAMEAAAVTLRNWIYNNFPKDAGSGAWLISEYNTSGQIIDLEFTSVELSTFRTEADVFIATIA